MQVVQYLSKDLDIILRTPWYVRSVFYTVCFYAVVLAADFGGRAVHLLPVLTRRDESLVTDDTAAADWVRPVGPAFASPVADR